MRPEGEGSICLYAHGRDYHGIRKRSWRDLQELLSIYGGEQKGYVDAGPVMERDHAGKRAAWGWRGRSGLIVRRKGGSRFFIATLLTTLELEPDAPVSHGCGSCPRRADLCPTGAIMENGQVDAGRCLSYWTIEHLGIHSGGNTPPGRDTAVRVRHLRHGLPLEREAPAGGG